MRLLLVEDDIHLGEYLMEGMTDEGLICEWVKDGESAEAAQLSSDFDVIILDWGLPDRSGFELLKQWKAGGLNTPILMLTARADVHYRVKGLDAGADDYLTKPFALAELFARLRSLDRRRPRDHDSFGVPGLKLDTASRQLCCGGQTVDLTKREYQLMLLFLRNPLRVLSRAVIADAVWGIAFDATSNVIDVHVRRLRRKLEAHGFGDLITTVRGMGYRLDPNLEGS